MNGIRIHQGDNTCLGLCFEPIVSMANHSCTPNAYISFIGRQLSLRALDPIKKGEEITISYIDPSYPLPIRQAELSRYYFTCTCDKCTSDWDTYATYLKCPKPSAANKKTTSLLTPPQTQKLLDHGTKFLRNPTNKPILAKATTLAEAPSATSLSSISQLTPLMNPIPLPIQPIPSLLDTLYLHHLDDYNFLRCLTIILCISFNIDPILYPQSTHPTRVYHLITAVQLMQQIIYLKPMEFVANPIPNRTTESLKIPSIKPAGGKIQTIHESMNYHQCAHALLILLDRLVDVSHGADSQWARNLRALLAEVKQGPNIKWEEREMDAGSERGEQVLKACFAELAELAGCIGEVVEATEGVA